MLMPWPKNIIQLQLFIHPMISELDRKPTHHNKRCCTEAKLIGTQHGRNDHIEAGTKLTVGLQNDSIKLQRAKEHYN